MGYTAGEVLQYVAEAGVQFIRLAFCSALAVTVQVLTI